MPKKSTDPAGQAADQAADQAAEDPAAAQPQPAMGGVYVRQPDGHLQAVEGPAAETQKE